MRKIENYMGIEQVIDVYNLAIVKIQDISRSSHQLQHCAHNDLQTYGQSLTTLVHIKPESPMEGKI